MTMSPDEGEDILAFGRTDLRVRKPRRRRLMYAAAGGTGLAGVAIAVCLVGFHGGAAQAAHDQQITLTQSAVNVGNVAQDAYAVPVRTGWLLKRNAPAASRPQCP